MTPSNTWSRSAADDADVWLDSQRLWRTSWPAFLRHDNVARRCFDPATRLRPDLTLSVGDRQGLAAVVNGVAITWDGRPDHLPGGWDGSLESALRTTAPDTAVGLAVMVEPSRRRQGWGATALRALAGAAGRAGLGRLIIPVRPTGKSSNPGMSMEAWVARRSRGEPVDPWLRTHERIGGTVLGICQRSMVIEGEADQWAAWTGRTPPHEGPWIVDGALAPVQFDGGRGSYQEPNVWIEHTVEIS